MKIRRMAEAVSFWLLATSPLLAQQGINAPPPLVPSSQATIQYQTGSLTGASGTIVSSNSGIDPFSGFSINNTVGANRFYAEGYTGTRAIVTNVEGGHVWNGHESLSHVNTFFDARATYIANGVGFNRLGQFDRHAAWVGHTLAGRATPVGNTTEYQRGIAYGATMWSGSLATDYGSPPWSNSWGWSRGYAYTDAYALPMLTGVNGVRTDVVNSSWGFSNSADATVAGGNNLFTVTLDGIARASRATVVFAAGNGGPATNTINAPGNGYNTISVGALGSDQDIPPYRTISSFSSRGPQLYNGPDGNFGTQRARVDITAPGQNMTLAFYGGLTGGNVGGTDPTGGAGNWYSFNAAGTSFAAPIVAGGATLLADVAYDRFTANAVNARDGQVIKAVLLNSASKPVGWNNGQTLQGNAVITTQALDYTYGAGILDLNRAFDQYTAGTTDVTGTAGGNVQAVGWDYGIVSQNGQNDYIIQSALLGNTTFTATLNWFVGRTWVETASTGGITSTDDYFTNLRLELWTTVNGVADTMVAQSDADFINTEHFNITLPGDDTYMLRVAWDGERYDFVNNDSQTYGLAWSGVAAVPEPTTWALLGVSLTSAGYVFRRRRLRVNHAFDQEIVIKNNC